MPAPPPIPQATTACAGLFNDGNLISLHCTSNTSHPCKKSMGASGRRCSAARLRSSVWMGLGAKPGGLLSKPTPTPMRPKCPGTRLWPRRGWCRSVPCRAGPWGAAALRRGGLGFVTRSRCAVAAGDVAAVSGHLHRFQVPRLKAGLVIKSKKCATSVVFHFPFSTSSLPAAHRR